MSQAGIVILPREFSASLVIVLSHAATSLQPRLPAKNTLNSTPLC